MKLNGLPLLVIITFISASYQAIKNPTDIIQKAIDSIDCFQIRIRIGNKESMPGFAIKLKDKDGNISLTILFISKLNYYPVRMRLENYSINNPEKTFFTDQTYYDLKFNVKIDTAVRFNTSSDSLIGYSINEMKP
jgi:hypothetical protein